MSSKQKGFYLLNILLIEDNKTYQKAIVKFIEKELLFVKFKIIDSFEKLKKINIKAFDIAICDYILPDTKEDEHIQYVVNKINTIVLTKYRNENTKLKFIDNVLDYIYKDDINTFRYLAQLVKRYNKNKNRTILIVDDSVVIRNKILKYLKLFNLNVFEAKDGKEAKNILEKEKIDLVITDIIMPVMNGFDLVKNIRKEKTFEELPVLGISGFNEEDESIKLLKAGANDFIKKPFTKEELLIRIGNLLDLYDFINQYKKKSQIDPLTKAFNRSILESKIESLFYIYDKKTICMLDIDFFKKINDNYGHQTGDKILSFFAYHIKQYIRKNDFLIRYGGEEFLIFMPNTTKQEAYIVLFKIKNTLQSLNGIYFTFSAGIADEGDTLVEMIKTADERLYQAKKEGRNKIIFK